ncbi:MAG: zinc-binding dehydrogenase [Candidatus Electryonea clarkiae]|nr:zinc-binding dehydrogenase [Candidatus Electryonea clarkiae]MDP8287603.1 zinc-binding dehydrogenase [Candidatus Electryonea clarkiae]
MKAAVFLGPNKPLEVQEVPTPEPKEGEILVKVAACGICHTDMHYIDHGVPTFKKPPMILGHEPSGTVAAMGSGVTNWKEGDRVLLPAVLSCGVCHNCRIGKENICDDMVMFGNHVDGAYAEYVIAPAKDALMLPEELPLEESSIIADAISTPYHAVVNRGEVKAGYNVVVFGCGGVGINAVQVAAAAGASVIAVDVIPEKLEWAKKLGATAVINAKEVDRIDKVVKKLTGGGADVTFECIGNPKTIQQAFSCIRKGGRTVVVGYTAKTVELPAAKIMFFEQEIVGSLGCRPVDYPRIIEMARIGKISVKDLVTARFGLDEINKGFDLMREGDPNSLRSIAVP